MKVSKESNFFYDEWIRFSWFLGSDRLIEFTVHSAERSRLSSFQEYFDWRFRFYGYSTILKSWLRVKYI